MGLFKRRKSLEELEEEKEYLTAEEEVLSKKQEVTERVLVIEELKKKYGSNWAKTLGISKLTDLSTLRSFLVSAKKGLEKQGSSGQGTPLGRVFNFRNVKKA